jgi:hypothetical protein
MGAIPELNNATSEAFAKRWRNLALGIGAAPFSSWIGARMLSDASFGARGGGGGHGGLLGAGGAGGFAEFYIAIEAFKKVIEYATQMFKKVIDEGFQLYVRSAQLHQTAGQLFTIQKAGEMVGLSQSQIDQFMLRNNWGRARTSLQNFGVFSQGSGLSADFKDAFRWASDLAQKWQETARTSYEIKINVERIKTDWLTLWNDSGFLGALDKLTKFLDNWLHAANAMNLGGASATWEWLFAGGAAGAITSGQKGMKGDMAGNMANVFNTPRTLPAMSHFEQIGFNIGGGISDQKKIASNTTAMVDLLRGIHSSVAQIIGFASYNIKDRTGSGALVNVP